MLVLFAGLAAWAQTRMLSEGTEIKVRTVTAIQAHPTVGAVYTATVSDDVPDTSGKQLSSNLLFRHLQLQPQRVGEPIGEIDFAD